ncbi:cytochrome P450 3A17-like [Centruroides sculpturatus]|uniref:cytochrome P450 3A17-like n=1 Tax=Centruroides sculpturatus TaxID=218467 RepID=UPI000C6D8A2C|nr:cytochrome P450 3A17-like [Centruroides sculpturatus]
MFPFSFVIGAITVIFLIFLWIRRRTDKLNLLTKCGIPGPKPNFLTGNFKEFQLEREKCIEEWFKKYGKIFGFYLGAKPYIMCSDIEFLKIMEVKEFKNFCIRDRIFPNAGVSHELAKHAIALQKSIKWKILRSVMTSSFTSQKIKTMSRIMHGSIIELMEKIKQENSNPLDIMELYRHSMFNAMSKLILGVTFNEESEKYNKVFNSLNYAFKKDIFSLSNKLSIYFPEIEPLPTYFRLFMDIARYIMNFNSTRYLFNTSKKIITSKKQLMDNQQDILQAFLKANRNKKLASASVLVNILMMLGAGVENMSFSLGWCIYFLAHNPKVQEKIRQEINKNIEKYKDIQYEDLVKLQYLDQAISETLRLSPTSLFIISRACEQDFVYKGLTIPKHVGIFVPTIILHRDPNYWQEPDKFDPDRFSPENRININPMIYQPFGAGPRNCVAYRMAQTLMKLIMANLIRSFIFDAYEYETSEMTPSIFFTLLKNPILIKATPITST